ncbi:MAG: hypothetical protein K5986_12255 [Clostridium sp.]|uniref:hypothetical protein n=1 Tax=Clostridium sp. DSM 8431 TaxID=1761781 RepID=UPI0008EF94CD|nr:hypothetical protein [Clostridium sp. DSM 8431]MCR4945178.1 hypothetical protein [Clostridium sp.]SFU34630.1 hypothetical protein SAMN04487886_101025 [Clostridium sp. DSM 8431]
MIETNEFPALKESVYTNDIFKNKNANGKVVIGDLENDTFFLIPEKQEAAFKKIINLMNGTNSRIDIINKTGISEKQLDNVLNKLSSKGFLKEDNKNLSNTIKETKYNEVDSLSLKLINYKFKDIIDKEGVKRKADFIGKGSTIFFILIILLLFSINIINGVEGFKGIQLSDWLSYKQTDKNNYWLAYILINFGMMIMFIFHESGHLIEGLRAKVQPSNIAFVLYLGFIPMFYVKNKNIYSLKRKEIYKILFAGVKVNLLLGLTLLGIFGLTSNEICKVLALSNFRLVAFNLCPLSLSDGYFIVCILLKHPNLRLKLHKFISNPSSILKYNLIEVIYTVFAFMTLIGSAAVEVIWIIKLFDFTLESSLIIFSLFMLIYVISLHFINKKRLKNIIYV